MLEVAPTLVTFKAPFVTFISPVTAVPALPTTKLFPPDAEFRMAPPLALRPLLIVAPLFTVAPPLAVNAPVRVVAPVTPSVPPTVALLVTPTLSSVAAPDVLNVDNVVAPVTPSVPPTVASPTMPVATVALPIVVAVEPVVLRLSATVGVVSEIASPAHAAEFCTMARTATSDTVPKNFERITLLH